MKRFTALLIALLMLCLMIPTGVAAEEEKPFWLTHFNNNTIEGSGVVFTEAYSGAGWWIHFAFAPTDVEGVYQIVDTSNGLADGSALALDIPEGGFVWAANYGNNYVEINNNPADIDYTSDNCSNAINDVSMSWMTGTLVKFTGLDLEGQTIPTSTPDVNWYDDAYVCTATYSIYEGDAEVGGESEAESEAESVAESEAESVAESEAESVAESKAESKEESVAATESSEAEENDEGGLSPIAIAAIVVAAVAIVAAVVVVILKKKKQ